MHQLVVVVIGFDGDVLASSDVGDEFVGPRAQVGDDGSTLTAMARHERHVVGASVRNGYGKNGKVLANTDQVQRLKMGREFGHEVQFESRSLVGENGNVPLGLNDFRTAAVIAVVVGDEHAVYVLRRKLQSGQSLSELGPAEPLIDEDFCTRGFKQGRVPSTARSQMRDGHRHANIVPWTREGLEHTACGLQEGAVSEGLLANSTPICMNIVPSPS